MTVEAGAVLSIPDVREGPVSVLLRVVSRAHVNRVLAVGGEARRAGKVSDQLPPASDAVWKDSVPGRRTTPPFQ